MEESFETDNQTPNDPSVHQIKAKFFCLWSKLDDATDVNNYCCPCS